MFKYVWECKGVSCLNCYEMNKSENEWLNNMRIVKG